MIASEEVRNSLRTATSVTPVNALDVDPPPSVLAAGSTTHWLTRQPVSAEPIVIDLSPAAHVSPAATALAETLETRRSQLLPGHAPARPLLEVLHRLGSSRHVTLDDAGRVWQSKPTPSAGGTHSVEPILHTRNALGLQPGWSRQAGSIFGEIALVGLPGADILTTTLDAALWGKVQPAATVFAVCDPHLLSDRYPAGSSLLWRDAGAFLMTAHLLMSAHRVSSTIVGVCIELPEMAAGDEVFVVGAVAVGGSISEGS